MTGRPFDLHGRVALVTGGNGGIGLGIARGLAKAGAAVVVAGRNPAKNDAARDELAALGGTAMAVTLDLRDPQSCRSVVHEAAAALGRLDILVNNAGTSVRKPPQDQTLEDWQMVQDTNVTGAFLMAQACYPHFRAVGGGKIISVGSVVSVFGSPFSIGYAASKGAILQMTRSLACAWARDNIQANVILPGWIETEMTIGARRDIPSLDDKVTTRTPAGRWGRPADFEALAVMLAGPGSDFITGAAIPVDGGYMAAG
jgi:2-dehydro-3-deoxy-D-gluconate 5-dehydrogenase